MPAISAHWAELITPQTTEAFYMGWSADGRRTSLIPTLYRIETSQRAFEDHIGVGQFGSNGWNFEDSGRVQYDQRNKGHKMTFTHKEFAKGHSVERKLVDDNLTQIIFDDARELGDSAFRLREKSAANIFINAFTDSGNDTDGFAIAGADGVGLGSLVHPNSADDTGSTQANEGTLTLTKANVSTTRQLHMALKDDRGDKLNIMPDLLLVPPELEDAGIEITKSVLDPTSANNAVNPQNGRFNLLPWHYLTDATAWFMIDSGRMKRDLIWYERIPVEYGAESDFDTFQARFRAYMRYSRGFRYWAWVYCQNG